MNTNILSKLEEMAYPVGTIPSDGENLRAFTTNASRYAPPVRLPDVTPDFLPIIVPTMRDILKNRRNIMRIMKLAAQRDGSLLIFLCSSPAKKEDVQFLADKVPGLKWLAVDGPFAYGHGNFETTYLPLSYGTEKDTSQKRNFALRLARYMGWKSVFFLDDDISITNAQLDKAYGLLQSRDVSVVGFNARQFPDNSVAVHAHRWLHDSIDSFIGTGAMAVKTNSSFLSFFPHIYNEDWLFLLIYRLLGEGNIIWAGSIKQQRYNPYKNIRRATAQEAGDIIGESLSKLTLVLCHSGQRFKSISDITAKFRKLANEDFWNIEINNRLDYLHGLQEDIHAKKTNLIRRHQAHRALEHAIQRILGTDGKGGITGKDLTEWTEAWCRDIEQWNTMSIPEQPIGTIQEAFSALAFTNQFIYHSDHVSERRTPAPEAQVEVAVQAAQKPYEYTGHTAKQRSPHTLEGLWLTKTVQGYLSDKNLRMDKIVTSADTLRFDRPTHWITNIKPLFTVSMIVAHGESIAHVRTSVQNILKWSQKCGPMQLIIWVYGDTSRARKHHLSGYRNRLVAQLMHDILGTHTQMRSSIITTYKKDINEIVDMTLNDISFAYWKQNIKAEHPIFVANSHGELLRLGTFCQFMHQEQLLPRKSLRYSLQRLALAQVPPQEISKESDTIALQTARSLLVQPHRQHLFSLPQLTTRHMVYRMKKARLDWVQLDDLAYNVVFHDDTGEESVEHIKRIICLPIEYHNNLPANKQAITREITQHLEQHAINSKDVFMIIVQGKTDNSWEEIDGYRKDLMKLIISHIDHRTSMVSFSYRLSPGESPRFFKRRVQAVAEYIHWLQNHTTRITLQWQRVRNIT